MMKNFIKKNLPRPLDSGEKMMYNLRVNNDKRGTNHEKINICQ